MDEQLISNISLSGHAQGGDGAAERAGLLDAMGFRRSSGAQYALIASCFLPSLVPAGTKAFRQLLDHFKVDYTLLPKEHCCGNLLLRAAARDPSGAEMQKADALARGFLEENLAQARAAGASRVIAFCAGCDLVYDRFRPSLSEEILWYPTFLARLFQRGRLNVEADYYPGCYYHHRKLNRSHPDLASVTSLLERIEGLKLNILDGRFCCNRREQLDSLLGQIKSGLVITPCGGCAMTLEKALAAGRGGGRVLMLPEVLWAAISGGL